jgi:hypothetical protein
VGGARPNVPIVGWQNFIFFCAVDHEPMEKQKQILTDSLNTWKGDLEQVDDVCLDKLNRKSNIPIRNNICLILVYCDKLFIIYE